MHFLDQFTTQAFWVAVGWFSVLITARTAVVFKRGFSMDLGPARGDPRRGIAYSLTFSMLPWKKDSTRRHPLTYAGGMAMHLGVFSTVLFALGRRFASWPDWSVRYFGWLAAIGLAGALGLFLKRISQRYMHAISMPDDFFANLLVQFYLLGGFLTAFRPDLAPIWRLAAVLLLFYIPLGKIYHMFLFFLSRALFGLQFGRRGVLRHDFPLSY
ncbi:MAG: hypothetical protein OEZ54_06975 [Gemmatimonadota bacterium]|nr:hypothetical protein [Gemmatimonadota bacterium]